MKAAVLTFAFLLPVVAWADEYLEFVRITCIPEARYFYFEYKFVSGPAGLTDDYLDDKKRLESMRVWQSHGYFDPANLEQDCRIPGSTYRLLTIQPLPSEHGMCGGTQIGRASCRERV